MFPNFRIPLVVRGAALLVVAGCNDAGEPPPASQADAAKLLLAMLDEAVRDAQAAQVTADFNEMEQEPDGECVPTPEPVVDRMLEMAEVEPDDVVYDLGCGDGRIGVRAAQRYGVKAWGFELDPDRVDDARSNVAAAGVQELVTIEQADIFSLDLSPASVVMLRLSPELDVRLLPQLQALEPGTRIVSHDFDFEGITPVDHDSLEVSEDPEPHEVFLWHAPLELDASEAAGDEGAAEGEGTPQAGSEETAPQTAGTEDDASGAPATPGDATSDEPGDEPAGSDQEQEQQPRQEPRVE